MIYGIGDLHLDHTKEKPMDVFGKAWVDHEERIFQQWRSVVREEDTVLIVGDISWGLKLSDAEEDLRRIDALPGKKIISKGNHDYWWSSLKKLEDLNLSSITFLHNSSAVVEGVGIIGTRGWSDIDGPQATEQDAKIYSRELGRLDLSYQSLGEPKPEEIIAMIHYPPFHSTGDANDFVYYLYEQGVSRCIYGHLHGSGHKYIQEGTVLGIEFQCVAADYLHFRPALIKED
ncbi:MAG: metallophosphoesterase [Tissierellia bacterium]|nr:metallophosphoesterase [Tissierellia bacterium]